MPSANKYNPSDSRHKPVLHYLVREKKGAFFAYARFSIWKLNFWRRLGVWPTRIQAEQLCKSHAKQLGHRAIVRNPVVGG